LERDAAEAGEWDVGERDAVAEFSFSSHHRAVFDEHAAFALGKVVGEDRFVAVLGEVGDAARAGIGHGGHDRVGGVEHGGAAAGDAVNDDAFDHGEVLDGADVVESEVVALADVGDDGDVAAVEPESFAEDAAAGGFQDGGIDVGVEQDLAGADGAAAIAAFDALAGDVDAIGVGHADAFSGET